MHILRLHHIAISYPDVGSQCAVMFLEIDPSLMQRCGRLEIKADKRSSQVYLDSQSLLHSDPCWAATSVTVDDRCCNIVSLAVCI